MTESERKCSACAVLLVVWVFLLLGGLPVASAQSRTSDMLGPDATLAVEAEISAGQAALSAFAERQEFALVTGAVDVQGRVARVGAAEDLLVIEIEGSARIGHLGREPTLSRAENPPWMAVWLGAALARRSADLTLRLSVGLAPPLRTVVSPQVPDAQLAAGWGDWDRWMVVEQVVPFGVLGLVESRMDDLDLGADLALVAAPSIAGDQELFDGFDYYRRPTGSFFWSGIGAWLRGHLGDLLSLGVRLQGVVSIFAGREERGGPILVVDDGVRADFQFSVVPFVRVSFAPGFVEARWQVNVDEPHGPIFVGANAVWAVALRGGMALDP